MTSASASFRAPGGVPGFLKAFMDEAYTLMSALLNPGRLIAEVETMGKLQREAAKIEATDPARAAALRRRASRMGL